MLLLASCIRITITILRKLVRYYYAVTMLVYINCITIISPLIRVPIFQQSSTNYATPTSQSFSKRRMPRKISQSTAQELQERERETGERRRMSWLEKLSSLLSDNGMMSNFNLGITSILFQFSCI